MAVKSTFFVVSMLLMSGVLHAADRVPSTSALEVAELAYLKKKNTLQACIIMVKKHLIGSLEHEMALQREESAESQRKNAALRKENDVLRERLAWLRKEN
jgi:hypothetical protein